MNKKLYWGLGVLFLLITGVFVLLLVQQKAELAKYKEDYALPTEKVAENEINPKTPSITENNLPPAEPGFKWVPHGDHYHQVPIDAPDTWQEGTHQKPVQPSQQIVSQQENRTSRERPKYTGGPTYEAYEKYVTEAWKEVKRNEFGLPISPLPAAPPVFRNREEEGKADRLWSRLLDEEDKRMDEAAIRMEHYHANKWGNTK